MLTTRRILIAVCLFMAVAAIGAFYIEFRRSSECIQYMNSVSQRGGEIAFRSENVSWLLRCGIGPTFDDIQLIDLSAGTEEDLKTISRMSQVEYVVLMGRSITDLKGLGELKKLHSLTLMATSVSSLKPLNRLSNLTSLTLYETTVFDTSSIAKCANLKRLYLERVKVKDYGPLLQSQLASIEVDVDSISEADVARLKKRLEVRLFVVSEEDG